MTIEGDVKYNDNQLTVHVTNRDFKNKSDGVVYWQRRQWKLFWFNTRILGKKEFTSKQFDQCGKTQIIKIEKKK